MATVNICSSPFTLNSGQGTNLYSLGNGGVGYPSTHVVSLVGATWVGSIVVKARQARPVGFQGTWAPAWVAKSYVPESIAGTAGNEVPIATALTGDFTIKIDSTGLEVGLDLTFTSGSATVYWSVLSGAAA